MKRIFALVALLACLVLAGCQNDAPISENTVRNKDGEVEGKEPSFKMVPAQKDPAATGN